MPVELMALRGIDHGLIGRNRAQTRNASLTALKATFAFFDRTLKGQ